jgi:hypothetical protein
LVESRVLWMWWLVEATWAWGVIWWILCNCQQRRNRLFDARGTLRSRCNRDAVEKRESGRDAEPLGAANGLRNGKRGCMRDIVSLCACKRSCE